MQLDRNQEKAMRHHLGPAIVIAGPGSGKTTVVTARILNLIRTHNVRPSQILAIAFNRKAVEEMGHRFAAALPDATEKPVIRTLHAFGKDILMENRKHPRLRIWSGEVDRIIAGEREKIEARAADACVAVYKVQSQATGRCYIGQTTDPDRRREEHWAGSPDDRLRGAMRSEGAERFRFEVLARVPGREANRREADWIARYRADAGVFNRADPLRLAYSDQVLLEMFCEHFKIPYSPELADTDLRERFEAVKEPLMRAKRQVVTGVFDPNTLTDPVVRAFAVRYEARKSKANAIDFEDMIIQAADLLETHPKLRRAYQERYPYLLVDEFQDIAPADFRLISLLSENLFAVGDDDQAIYGFRGGDSEIMQAFAGRRGVKRYEIARNYRSTSTIVEHARGLIERNSVRIRKNLRAQNPRHLRIRVVESTLKRVKAQILEVLADSEETAILARTNYETDMLQDWFGGHRVRPEVTTIHKAKGREWARVILVHNTLGRRFPHRGSDLAEARRVFYVAMTRAKTELVVIGGRCPFVTEFSEMRKNAPYYLRQLAYRYARWQLKK